MNGYWAEGFDNLSMNEVCRRAKAAKPSVYREFGSEDGLMAAAVAHYRQTVVAHALAALSSERPFGEVLAELLEWMTTPFNKPAGCLLAELRTARARLGPSTLAAVDAAAAELRQAYERWYRRAVAHGEVDAGVAPTLAAHFIDTQFTTVLLQMGSRADPHLVREQAELAFRSLRVSAGG